VFVSSTPVEDPVENVVTDGGLSPELTATALWERGASALRSHLSDATWLTWFEGVRALRLEDETLFLTVPSTVVRDRISSTYTGLIRDVLREAVGEELQIELVVEVPKVELMIAGPRLETNREVSGLFHEAGATVEVAAEPAPTRERTETLNPRYSFEEFVIGASNRFAWAAALSVAETPAKSYNPLFIYGAAGLGKTHLLQAIGHYVLQQFPHMLVRYVSTETFMNEFVDAIRTNTMPDFKRRYRSVNVLLVDDIQFMESKEGLQEEFFHTFNSLYENHNQIVISSDRPPNSIATLEDRLRTRFGWGLITDIQPPEFETRLAILQKKAELKGFTAIPDAVYAFIAAQITDNVRELEGALIRVAAYANLNRVRATEDLARHVLSDLLPSSEPRVITPQMILDETAKMFGWTVDELIGKSRRRTLVIARQIGMYVFRELTDYSYPQIGKVFGGRDHTTVMHAVTKIDELMGERRAIFDQVNELTNRIRHGSPSS
jgi:chromosomal replication initiator protein